MKKVYLAGPMTDIPQSNIPLFDRVAQSLRSKGWTVISPSELDDLSVRELCLNNLPTGHTWGDFLSRDVKVVADGELDAICLLPGWMGSKGARLEAYVGLLCGLHFYEVTSDDDLYFLDSYTVAGLLSSTLREDAHASDRRRRA